MKVFIVLASLLAISFAGHYPQVHYPLHIPVIDHTGVPLESPEIVHSRQAHLSHVVAVKSRQDLNGYKSYGYTAGYGHGYGGYGYTIRPAYPIIGQNGVPIDTPEVQSAKAAHFAAYQKAVATAAYNGNYEHEHYRKKRGIFVEAVSHLNTNGIPIDTPEVQAAKAAHFAAHANLSGLRGTYISGISGAFEGVHHYGGYSQAPLDHDGRVREVEALKAKHLQAHAAAYSRTGIYGHSGSFAGGYQSESEDGYEKVNAYNAGHNSYNGPQHIPIIGKLGIPLDTPEVVAARQYHLKALADASSKSYEHGYH